MELSFTKGHAASSRTTRFIENLHSGITVRESSDPIARRNTIRGNKRSGVLIIKDGGGSFEDNQIIENGHSGVSIGKGKVKLKSNLIKKNEHAGIYVTEGGDCIAQQNQIQENGYEAVWVDAGGAGVFKRNDLTDNLLGAWDIAKADLGKITRQENNPDE